ncbi:MAG TPA: LON peptidase substrate-binding domain-containing protein [Thermoanaerobaculia bacterium]|nr:LON peptidase substrate-binding domain-containing protein [Thermoanaerobaculia bacterium]
MTQIRLPLFPLPGVVHFPRTELRLHVFEPRYRQLLRDLEALPASERWVGMVLIAPGGSQRPRPILSPGTAARLMQVERLPDGRSNILLVGGFRFEIRAEIDGAPYRRAEVGSIEEAPLDEDSPAVRTLRSALCGAGRALQRELGERSSISAERLVDLAAGPFELLVNGLATELDLSPLQKLELLRRGLPSRGRDLHALLQGRVQMLDLLRPLRALATRPELN